MLNLYEGSYITDTVTYSDSLVNDSYAIRTGLEYRAQYTMLYVLVGAIEWADAIDFYDEACRKYVKGY